MLLNTHKISISLSHSLTLLLPCWDLFNKIIHDLLDASDVIISIFFLHKKHPQLSPSTTKTL